MAARHLLIDNGKGVCIFLPKFDGDRVVHYRLIAKSEKEIAGTFAEWEGRVALNIRKISSQCNNG